MTTQSTCPVCNQSTADGLDTNRCVHCGSDLLSSGTVTPLGEAVTERAPTIPAPPRPGWDRHRDDDEDERPRSSRGAPADGSSTSTIVIIVCVVVGALVVLPLLGFLFLWLVFFADNHPGAGGPKRAIAAPAAAVQNAVADPPAPLPKNAFLFKVIPAGAGEFKRPALSAVPTNYLRAVSAEGDFIGQGKTYFYTADQLKIRRTDRGVNLEVDGWLIDVGAPRNQVLEVGEYAGVKRFPFSDSAPGLQFFGQGRACNQIAGRFVVWEIETNGNQFTRLAIDLVQNGERLQAGEQFGPPLTGTLRINSTFE